MRPLVTMGYCLGLSEAEREDVLLAAGLSFSPHDKTDQAYKFLFSAFPSGDINECNEFLETQGGTPLGSQSRK